MNRSLILLPLLVAALAGCKPENKFQPPPPPEITIALPLEQEVVPFEVQTGNTVAFNTVDLVARVEGFLTSQNYVDGAIVKKGDTLFVIEQTMYKAKVQEAEAGLAAAKAQLGQAEAEFSRQQTLLQQNVSAQNVFDQAKAKRDSARANVENVGELVGNGVATKLATIVQLDPIYVEFNVSEQDVLKIRANLKGKRMTVEELAKIPLAIGLMNEEGFPHAGFMNYVSPEIDPNTGTILVRGLFQNSTHALLPGYFARVRMPMGLGPEKAMLVPNRVIAEDQAGRYVLVVNKDNVVEQRRITQGMLLPGGLRAITKGLAPTDQVVLTTSGRAVPGGKVVPKMTTLTPPPPGDNILK